MLLALQQAGNVKYMGWILQVPCSADPNLVGMLQKKAKEMEDELAEWKETVKSKREDYYELNYFTTLQLLALRRELGRVFNSNQVATVSPDVLALLQSVSSHVTAKEISCVCGELATEPFSVSMDYSLMETEEIEDAETFSASAPDDTVPSSHLPSSKLNEPSFAVEELTEEEKEMMATICSRIDCSEKLVVRAFKECPGEDNNIRDYLKWCNDRLFEDAESESEEQETQESSSDEDSSESESETGWQDDVNTCKWLYCTIIATRPCMLWIMVD